MNLKKILPILLLLVVVLSISSVAAADPNFTDLQEKIDATEAGGTLHLTDNYTAATGDKYLIINKTITIDGLSKTGKTTYNITLSEDEGPDAMFVLMNGAKLTLQNVNINIGESKDLFYRGDSITKYPACATFENASVYTDFGINLDTATIINSKIYESLAIEKSAYIAESEIGSLEIYGTAAIFESKINGACFKFTNDDDMVADFNTCEIGMLSINDTDFIAIDSTFMSLSSSIKSTFNNITSDSGITLLNESSLMNSNIAGDVNIKGENIVLFNNTIDNNIVVYENATISSEVSAFLGDTATFLQGLNSADLIPVFFVDDNNNTIIFDPNSEIFDTILTIGDAKNKLVYNEGVFALNTTEDVLGVAGNFTAKDLSIDSGNLKDVAVSFAKWETDKFEAFDGWVYVEPTNTLEWLNAYIAAKKVDNKVIIPTNTYYASENDKTLNLDGVKYFDGNNSVIDFKNIANPGYENYENLMNMSNIKLTNINTEEDYGEFIVGTTGLTFENVTISNVNGIALSIYSPGNLINVKINNASYGIALSTYAEGKENITNLSLTNNKVDFLGPSDAFDNVYVRIAEETTAFAYQKVNLTATLYVEIEGKEYSVEVLDLVLKVNDTLGTEKSVSWKDGTAYIEYSANELGKFKVSATESAGIKDVNVFDGTLIVGMNKAVAEMERTGVNAGVLVTDLVVINGTQNNFKFTFKDQNGNVITPKGDIYYTVNGGAQTPYDSAVGIKNAIAGEYVVYVYDTKVNVTPTSFTLKAVNAQPKISTDAFQVDNTIKVTVENTETAKDADVVVDIYVNDVLAYSGLTIKANKEASVYVSKGIIAGENNVTVVSRASDKFYPVEKKTTGVMFQAPTITVLDIDSVVVYADKIVIKGTVSSSAYGLVNESKVTIMVDGVTAGQADVVDGEFSLIYNSLIYKKLALGEHYISASFEETVNFGESADALFVTVVDQPKVDTETVIAVDVVDDIATIEVVVLGKDGTVVNTGKVVAVVDGEESATLDIVDGVATWELGISKGPHSVVVTFDGDDKYNPSAATEEFFNVEDYEIIVDDLVKIYGADDRLVATFLIDGEAVANATLVFTVNGKEYSKVTDENGQASIGINLAPGEYVVTVVADTQQPASANATVTILSTIAASDVDMLYKDGTGVVAAFIDSEGNALANTVVSFQINGVWYNRTTDENGIATLKLNLLPNEYICTIYNPVTGESTGINVIIRPIIVADDLVKVYGEEGRFTATFYNQDGTLAAGQEVCFNIHGVFYYKTTDANGQASLNINLLPGDYIITTFFGATPETAIASAGNLITVKEA